MTGLAWSPSLTARSTLASIGKDGQVLLWNVTGQQQQLSPLGKQSPGVADIEMVMAWSPDGSIVAIGNVSSQSATLDFNTYIIFYKGDLSGPVTNLNGLAEANGAVKIANGDVLYALSWAPSPYLIAGIDVTNSNFNSPLTSQYFLLDPTGITKSRNLSSSTLPYYFNVGNSSNSGLIRLSPDGTTLAITATDSSTGDDVALAKIISGPNPSLRSLKPISFSLIGGVTWSADGKFLAAFSTSHSTNPGPIAVWDSQNFKPAGTPQTGTSSDLMALAWSPSSNHYLAAGDNNSTIFVWRYYPNNSNGPGTGNDLPILTLAGPAKAKVMTLAWSQDGRWLAAGFNDTNDSIYVWDSSRWQG